MKARPWTNLKEPWERLVWAREQRYASAAEAARALAMKEGTYRAYERRPDASKATRLDYEAAKLFGRRFSVSWTWLLSGSGTPHDVDLSSADLDLLLPIFLRLRSPQRRQLLDIARTFLVASNDEGAHVAEVAEAEAAFLPAPRR